MRAGRGERVAGAWQRTLADRETKDSAACWPGAPDTRVQIHTRHDTHREPSRVLTLDCLRDHDGAMSGRWKALSVPACVPVGALGKGEQGPHGGGHEGTLRTTCSVLLGAPKCSRERGREGGRKERERKGKEDIRTAYFQRSTEANLQGLGMPL